MTERELFVKKYREIFNVDKSLFVNEDGRFQDEFCQSVYEIWQAAIQREGFKFVPVEPTLKMVRASEYIKSSKTIRQDIYKAMIGAIDD